MWAGIRRATGGLRFRVSLLVLLAVLPAVGFVIFLAAEQRRDAAIAAKHEALGLARLISARQEESVVQARQLLAVLATHPVIQGSDPASCNAFLADLATRHPDYTSIVVADANGTVWCDAVPRATPVNVKASPTFQTLLETRDFVIGSYRVGQVTGRPILGFGFPVFDESGTLEGGIFAGLDLSRVNVESLLADLPEGSSLTMVDRNGTVVLRSPDPEEWIGKSVADVPIIKAAMERRGLATGEGEVLSGPSRLVAYGPVIPESGDLFVLVGIPKAIAFSPADANLRTSLVGIGGVVLLALAAAWIGGDAFVLRRTRALVAATRRLAGGDFDARSGQEHGPGELGQLAHAFDSMAGALKEREADRERAEDERERRIREQSAREAAEHARQRADFLARAGTALASSLDYQTALGDVVRLLVPEIADWASFSTLDDQRRLQVSAVAHRNADRTSSIAQMLEQYRPGPEDWYGSYHVIRTGKSELYQDIADEALAKSARNEEHLRLLRSLEIKHTIIVPVAAHGQTYGALTLVTSTQERRFSQDDLAFAEDLGRRCGLAIYSSKAYAGEQLARSRAEAGGRRRAAQYAVSRALMDAPTVDVAAQRVLAAIGENLGWDFGGLWLEDQAVGPLACAATWSSSEEPRLPKGADVRLPALRFDTGPALEVRRSGHPVWVSDSGVPVLDGPVLLGSDDFRSAMLLPVTSDRGIVGVLGMYSRRPITQDPEAMDSLATMGNQIGLFIERMRDADLVRELSTPVLPIGDRLLLVPVIGRVSPQRASQMTERILNAVRVHRARVVVMDVTGVAFMDESAANRIVQTVEAARLLGARVIVTGLSSDVCQTLIGLGIDLAQLETVGDLHRGIEHAEQILRGTSAAATAANPARPLNPGPAGSASRPRLTSG